MVRLLRLMVCAFCLSSALLISQEAQDDSGFTMRIDSQLVVVDVVAADIHQAAVHHLKASDFVILENGVPQQVKNFEEHIGGAGADLAKVGPLPVMPPGVFTNYSPVPSNGPVNILLLDALNTPTSDQAFMREQLQQYLKHATAGTRIAIFGLTTRLTLLQGVTTNPELLKLAIRKKYPESSPLLADQSGNGGEPSSLSDTVSSSFGNDPNLAGMVESLQEFETRRNSMQLQLRTRYTLDALNMLARYLNGIPGRKNLIWFSGSFPLNVLPDGSSGDPFGAAAGFGDEFRETVNILTRSQVAVYPVDARGLMGNAVFNAANSGNVYAHNPSAFAGDSMAFLQQTGAEHATMLQMAEETGGRAFINTNDLSGAVSKAVNTGSSYYTLTYSPKNTNWNGDFRKIEVRCTVQGVTLSYRRGYYAEDPYSANSALSEMNASPSFDSLRAAMLHGSPDSTQIIIKVRVVPASQVLSDQPAKGNYLNPALNVHGPFRSYTVDLAADPSNITMHPGKNHDHEGALQFITYVYDHDGRLVILRDDRTHADLSPAAYANFERYGVFWHQEISVPAKDDYSLRIAIRDFNSDRIGAVEIPIAAVRDLPASAAGSPTGQSAGKGKER